MSDDKPVGREIAELLERLARAVENGGFSGGLNPAQWSALRYLNQANRFSRSTSAFATYHGTTRGTASQTIKALVDKGLVGRAADGNDRRRTQLTLTRRGQKLLAHDPSRRLVAAADAIPASQQSSLIEGLRSIWKLSDGDRNGEFGPCELCQYLCPCDIANEQVGQRTGHYCGKNGAQLRAEELQMLCVNFQSLNFEH